MPSRGQVAQERLKAQNPRGERGWGWEALWKPLAQFKILDWKHEGRQSRFDQDISFRWDMTPITSCWFCSEYASWSLGRLSLLGLSVPTCNTLGSTFLWRRLQQLFAWEFSQADWEAGGWQACSEVPCPIGSGVTLMSNLEQLLRGVWKPETNEILHMSLWVSHPPPPHPGPDPGLDTLVTEKPWSPDSPSRSFQRPRLGDLRGGALTLLRV